MKNNILKKCLLTIISICILSGVGYIGISKYIENGRYTDYKLPNYMGLELEEVKAIKVNDKYFEEELEWMVKSDDNENTLNAAYVKTVSTTSTTVDEYREEVRTMLEERSENLRTYELQEAVWKALIDGIEISVYPKFTMKEFTKEIYDSIEEQGLASDMTLQEYINSLGYDEETFDEYVNEVAQEKYRVTRTMETIIENENLELSKKELNDKILELVHLMGYETLKEAKKNGHNQEDLELNVWINIITEFLVESAEMVEQDN